MATPEVIVSEDLLEKICSSAGFQRSRRLQRFLRYVLRWAIENPGQPLKEYAIAIAVYDKRSSFDPQTDPIVRVEASRLRSRLLEYYSGAGATDPLTIELPKGSYVPIIRSGGPAPRALVGESIAVVPWQYGADPDLEYLSHGIAESVTRRLANIPDLRVAPWSMAIRLKGCAEDLEQTAKLLGVRTLVVLKLSARRDSYQVEVEWLNPEQRTHLWGCRYTRTVSDLHCLEDELTVDLIERIAAGLAPRHVAQIKENYTNNGRAYRWYLKGRYLWNKRTSEAMLKAIRHYQRALDEDPTFALAFAGIADSYITLGTFGFLSPGESLRPARAAALRALDLSDLGEAHTILASLHAFYEWEWQQAEAEFQKAITLAPKHAPARQWYGVALCATGRFASGCKILRSALDLDPLSPMITVQLAVGYYLERRYADSIRVCKSVLETDPEFWPAWLFLGQSSEQVGRTEEAIAQLRAATEFSSRHHVAVSALAHCYARTNARDSAVNLLGEIETTSEYVAPFSLALVHCGLADRDATLDCLEKSCSERSPSVALWLRGEPRLDWLRKDSRFRNLVESARLSEESI